MTKVIKVNCRNIWIAVGIIGWISGTLLTSFGVYVQETTLQTYDKTGDCHIGYFDGKQSCVSNNDKPKAEYYSYSPNEIRGFEIGFLVILGAIQIIVWVVLNSWKQWVKLECKTKESN